MNNTTYFEFYVAVVEPSLWIKASFIIYTLVILLIGVPGNIIVASVYSRTSPKSACDWLIFIMSVTDCVVCFCTPLLYMRVWLHISLTGKLNIISCFQIWLQFSAMIASCLILVVIAVDRYIKICCHYVASLTPIRARNLGVLCVVIATVVCVFPFVRQGQTIGCAVYSVKPPESVKIFAVIMICGFIVCFVIMIFAYANICKKISAKTTLKQRLKNGNGLITSVSDTHPSIMEYNKSWWRQRFLKQRRKSKQILEDPKTTEGNECSTQLNSHPVVDISNDGLQGLAQNYNQCLPKKRVFVTRHLQLKKSVSCPHLNMNKYDQMSHAIHLRKFPVYASHSEIFDVFAKRNTSLTTKCTSDFSITCTDRTSLGSKHRKQEVVFSNNNKLLSFKFPVPQECSLQQSTESYAFELNGKSEYAVKYSNRLRYNEDVSAICDVIRDVCVVGNSTEDLSTTAHSEIPPSTTYSLNINCNVRGCDKTTCDHNFRSIDLDRHGYFCHDNISETILGYPGEVSSGLGNGFGLGFPYNDAVSANDKTGYNKKTQTELCTTLKKVSLKISFLPKLNPTRQKSEAPTGDRRKTASMAGKWQMSQVITSSRKYDDDLHSAPSSSGRRKQTNESQVQNPVSSKYEAKSLVSSSRNNRERQMTLMLASVTATFLLSWLPPWLFHMLWYYGAIENSQSFVVWYLSKTYLILYAANPLLYYNFNRSFRLKVGNLLGQVFKCSHCRRA